MSGRRPADPQSPLRASHLLRNPAVWVPPAVMASVLVFVMTLIANFEPLRQILAGVRAILYLNAQGAVGLTRAWVATAIGLVFWVVVGAAITIWYDRRGLSRLPPDLLEYVNRTASEYVHQDRQAPAGERPGSDAVAGPEDGSTASLGD
jgi:hypothetical protein